MNLSEVTKEWLEEQYKNKSTTQIASELGTYPVKVQRLMKDLGIKVRTRSERQSQYLLTTDRHPTRGKKRPEEVKNKISRKNSLGYMSKSDEEKKEKSELAKQRWNKKTKVEQKEFQKQGLRACRQAIKEGSKLERFIYQKLLEHKYRAEFHKEQVLVNTKMHIDIFLPQLRTIIEVDGPSHYRDIWGLDTLLSTRQSDIKKNGILLTSGYTIIRIIHIEDNINLIQKEDIWKQLLYTLQKIVTNRLKYHERYIEIETKFKNQKP